MYTKATSFLKMKEDRQVGNILIDVLLYLKVVVVSDGISVDNFHEKLD